MERYQRHYCPCKQHVYAAVVPEGKQTYQDAWRKCSDDECTCPHCGAPRFKVIHQPLRCGCACGSPGDVCVCQWLSAPVSKLWLFVCVCVCVCVCGCQRTCTTLQSMHTVLYCTPQDCLMHINAEHALVRCTSLHCQAQHFIAHPGGRALRCAVQRTSAAHSTALLGSAGRTAEQSSGELCCAPCRAQQSSANPQCTALHNAAGLPRWQLGGDCVCAVAVSACSCKTCFPYCGRNALEEQ